MKIARNKKRVLSGRAEIAAINGRNDGNHVAKAENADPILIR